MGKKVKKKARSGQKDKRGHYVSPVIVSQPESSNAEAPANGVVVIKGRGLCSHVETGINLEILSSNLRSSESIKCQDCRGNAIDRRAKKGQGKQGKKGGTNSKSESKAIWICLECGHYSCGGVGLPTTPQSHAIRHSKQNRHPLVVHYEKHQLVWCFPCDKIVHADSSEDNKHKEVLDKVVKLLKEQPGEGSTVDVEDIWFGSSSVTSAVKSNYSISTGADERAGYSIRGLVNLGNTCFFNSVMQNLFALNSLRDHFFKLDESVGPLSAAMRKFFLEMCNEDGSKGVISPRSIFGSLCTKAPQFRGYQQHDSHELLRCLLDVLSTEESAVRKDTKCSQASITHQTFVDTVFGGQLSSTVSCLECGHSSTIYEPFLDLSLPVPTKKPPTRKTQVATRGKKQKLPPKRGGRNLPKVNRETNTLTRESAFAQSTVDNSSGQAHLLTEAAEQPIPSLSDPDNVALDMGLTSGDLSAIQNPVAVQHDQPMSEVCFSWLDYLDPSAIQNPVAVQHDQPMSEDCFSRLDYLDSDPVSHETDVARETDNTSATQDFANEDGQQHDVSLAVASDSRSGSNAVNEVSVDNAKDFKNNHPGVIAQEQNASSQFDDAPNVKPELNDRLSHGVSITEEVVQSDAIIGDSPESCSEVSNTSGRDNKNTSEISDPHVMSCPDKEAVSSSVKVSIADTEVSSALANEEQDSLGFDGFGDLFNEPEVFSEPSDQPVSQASDNNKKGVIGNASESDPDEVDNSDAPVSVESCLALFTKPEFLSKDEHAWHCENCSKLLREQKIKSKDPQILKSDIVPNGFEDRNPSGQLDVERSCNTMEVMNESLEVDPFIGKSVPQGEVSKKGKCMVGSQSELVIDTRGPQSGNKEFHTPNSCQGPAECSTSSSQTLAHCGESDSDNDGSMEGSLVSKKCVPEKREQAEVNTKNLKVRRDANKSILISKVPSILTIHLKRFSQDARGWLSKLNGHVNFREMINLKPYVDPRCNDEDRLSYRLVGVVEHLGTMRGGHYVAYIRGMKENGDGVWYHASDAYVRHASLEEVLHCEAYILFFERT